MVGVCIVLCSRIVIALDGDIIALYQGVLFDLIAECVAADGRNTLRNRNFCQGIAVCECCIADGLQCFRQVYMGKVLTAGKGVVAQAW